PVHVEAVANLVGRAELMAGAFAVLAVYAALARDSVGWSAAALAAGLLSKENAAVVPALIAWAWVVGLERPSRRRMAVYAASWVAVGAAYVVVRWMVLRHESTFVNGAPIFIGASPWAIRLTAVAGGVRTALRVPVWRDELSVVLSELEDSPRSYAGPAHMVVLYLNAHQPAKALEAFRRSIDIYDATLPWVYVTGAEAAISAGF